MNESKCLLISMCCLGVEGGNLIITETAVDGLLNPFLELVRVKSVVL